MFSKKDIFPLKLAMERDRRLSDGATRLGSLVCSYVFNQENLKYTPDEPFALPWTLASKICFGISQRECYARLRELVDCDYFKHHGAKGCPAKAHFSLVIWPHIKENKPLPSTAQPSSPSTAQPSSPSTAQPSSPSSAAEENTRTAQKCSPPSKLLPTEEMVLTNEGRNGAQARRNEGKLNAARPQMELTDAKRAEHVQALSQLRREIAGDGKTKPKTKTLLRKK
jgi:hypothetical protein